MAQTSLWEEFNNLDVNAYAAQHPALFAYVREQMASPEKQYLLIGDTNHTDIDLRAFIHGPQMAALFKYASIPHANLEFGRESAPPSRLAAYKQRYQKLAAEKAAPWRHKRMENNWWQRVITDTTALGIRYKIADALIALDDLRKNKEKRDSAIAEIKHQGGALLGFTRAGMHVTAADSWQWVLPHALGIRLFMGDREVGDYIREQAQGDKSGIIYGSDHFRYDDALGSRLGRKKCFWIDIYQGEETYKPPTDREYADHLPDRVYLVKQKKLTTPDQNIYRTVENKMDDDLQSRKFLIELFFGAAAPLARKIALVNQFPQLPDISRQYFNFVPAPPQ